MGPSKGEPFDQIEIPMIRTEEEQLRVFCGVKGPEDSDGDVYSKRISVEQSFLKDAVNDVNSLESVTEYSDARFHVANMHGRDDVTLSLNSALDNVQNIKEVFSGLNDGFKDVEGMSEEDKEARRADKVKEVQQIAEEAVEEKRKEVQRCRKHVRRGQGGTKGR